MLNYHIIIIVTLPERLIALCSSPAFTYKGNRTLAGLRGGSAVGSRLPRVTYYVDSSGMDKPSGKLMFFVVDVGIPETPKNGAPLKVQLLAGALGPL